MVSSTLSWPRNPVAQWPKYWGRVFGLAHIGQFWAFGGYGRMEGFMRQLIWVIPVALALAGCGAVSFGGASKQQPAVAPAVTPAILAPSAAPLDTAAIQTQTLAPAAIGAAPATGRVIGANTAPIPAPTAPTQTSAPQSSAADIGAAALAALKISPQGASAAAPAAAAPSLQQQACIAKGGRWEKAGSKQAQVCVQPAADAGKSCSKQSDCSSQCMARSRSCAPFWPIMGCTDVIQNNGAVVALCLE